ncbi:hypothetical protein F5Y13DRAFT_151896 [Hypoxylon sp. FL1857]|nr:hypothetical protein F5Y13DRAFT_151896 [Hypoxylon sp. FL1857]
MAPPSTNDPNPEVPEFSVMVLNGTRHPALNGAADSGVIYRSSASRRRDTQTRLPDDYKELYTMCSAPANELIVTANKYLRKRGQPLLQLGDFNSWVDVESSMMSTCNTLDALAVQDHNTNGFTNKVKSAFRALCQKAEIGLTFASMVPSDMPCGSVLCGGLKAIFTALERTHNYREDVYRAIEDIPYIINDHAVYIDIDTEDEELHRRNAALYQALFRLMQHILLWFVKNPVVTGIKLLVSPQGFAESLKNRVAEVERAAARFEKHALFLRNQRNDESLKLQHWMAYKLGENSEDLALVRARCEALESINQLLQQSHHAVMEWGTRKLGQLEASSYEDITDVVDLRKDLLQELGYDEHLVGDDCEDLLSIRKGSGSGLDTERISSIQNHPQLQAWMSLGSSSILLVDGCSASSSCEVSYVAAQVVESVWQFSKSQRRQSDYGANSNVFILPLAFFCSQHRNRRRDFYGKPTGVAKAFLSQLIGQFHGFGAEELQACQDELASDGIDSVCKAFRKLAGKLPANSIVILVLEGIDILMEEKTRDALRYMLQSLVKLHRGKHAATLKFLFTCTTSSEPVEDLFEGRDILRIPRMLRSIGSYRSFTWKDSGNLGVFGNP